MLRQPWVFALAALLPLGVAAQADPLAGLDKAQVRAVQQFLKKQSQPGQGDAQPDSAHASDLDGDGKPEVVLLWTFLGPTYGWSRVTLFTPAAQGWRHAASVDVAGQAQGLRLRGRDIEVDTLTLGPSDARCCPSVKHVQRIRWQGGALVSNRSSSKL
jgi:hypothetical protein